MTNDPEARLAAFLAKDDPPARDIRFEVNAAARLSRRLLGAAWLAAAPRLMIVALIAWAAATYLAEAGGALQGWELIPSAVALAVAFWLIRRGFVRYRT